jgi:hypothetical protein
MYELLHELFHFKQRNLLQKTIGENQAIGQYSLGVTLISRGGKKMLFNNLNEAIVDEISKNCLYDLAKDPIFEEEMSQTMKIDRECPNVIHKKGTPLFDNDIIYAQYGEGGEKEGRIKIKRLPQAERATLNTLIDKIFKERQGEFPNREDVFNVFAGAALAGDARAIIKIVDHTFGIGTMQRIQQLEKDPKKQKEFVETQLDKNPDEQKAFIEKWRVIQR